MKTGSTVTFLQTTSRRIPCVPFCVRVGGGGTPRWVKVLGVLLIPLVLVVVMVLSGGHGPGLHSP